MPAARVPVLAICLVAACGRGSLFIASNDDMDDPRYCPRGDRPFANEVVGYVPDFSGFPPTHPDVLDPEAALGSPDYTSEGGLPGVGAVALGQGGRLELAFSGCRLTNDGTSSSDVRIYEVGPAVESVAIFLRSDPETITSVQPDRRVDPDEDWFFLGDIGGAVTDLDIDVLSVDGATVVFDALRLEDDVTQGSGSDLAWGADIDAVELLTWTDAEDE